MIALGHLITISNQFFQDLFAGFAEGISGGG